MAVASPAGMIFPCPRLRALGWLSVGLLLVAASGVRAQESVRLNIGGTVSKAVQLEVDSESASALQNSGVQVTSAGQANVRLVLAASAQEERHPIRVLLRSNCEVQLLAHSSIPGLVVKVLGARAGGALVHREALDAASTAGAVGEREINHSLIVFESSRISAGGFRNSPANALRLTLEFTFPPALTDQPVAVTLELKAR